MKKNKEYRNEYLGLFVMNGNTEPVVNELTISKEINSRLESIEKDGLKTFERMYIFEK